MSPFIDSPFIEYFDALIMWLSYHVTDKKCYISTFARPMATKLDRVGNCNVDLVTQGHMTNEKCYKFMVASKLERRMAYD